MHSAKDPDKEEVKKFSSLSSLWWNENGPFKALHKITIPRLQFIIPQLKDTFSRKEKDIKLLDVGCGGGLVCEPLSRLGYSITGIDASSKVIKAAKEHAKTMKLAINYKCTTLLDLNNQQIKADAIFLLELLEHVSDPKSLIHTALDCLKPGGLLFFSTLNRTPKSYIFGIQVAENLLNWAPKGAHSYKKFLKPSEIQSYLEEKNYTIHKIQGITFNIIKNKWELSDNLNINYIGVAKKSTFS